MNPTPAASPRRALPLRLTHWLLACGLLLLTACRRDPSQFEISNLNGNSISALGHAGMGMFHRHPINSRESIETSLRIGADGTEVDVQMSRDGTLVLFHDQQLESSTNLSGMLNSQPIEVLQSGHYKGIFSGKPSLLRLETLFAERCGEGQTFFLDCKFTFRPELDYEDGHRQFAESLNELIARYGVQAMLCVESGDPAFLAMIREQHPQARLFLFTQEFGPALQRADEMNLYGIITNSNNINAAQVQEAHAHGRRVALLGMKSVDDNIAAIAKSPDYLQSDRLPHLLKVFSKYKAQP